MTAQTDVIDWQEAMQQCGDDEEFLREVLADLRTEVEAQLSIIAEIINVSILPLVSPFHELCQFKNSTGFCFSCCFVAESARDTLPPNNAKCTFAQGSSG